MTARLAWSDAVGKRVRTGDLAEMESDGGFTFLSRMGDVLRLSGFLVNPLEIETHVQKVPGIDACTTIALPRPDGVRAVIHCPQCAPQRVHSASTAERSPSWWP